MKRADKIRERDTERRRIERDKIIIKGTGWEKISK